MRFPVLYIVFLWVYVLSYWAIALINQVRTRARNTPVLTAMGKNFQNRHYLYPIPQGEVDKSAGTIAQNPDY